MDTSRTRGKRKARLGMTVAALATALGGLACAGDAGQSDDDDSTTEAVTDGPATDTSTDDGTADANGTTQSDTTQADTSQSETTCDGTCATSIGEPTDDGSDSTTTSMTDDSGTDSSSGSESSSGGEPVNPFVPCPGYTDEECPDGGLCVFEPGLGHYCSPICTPETPCPDVPGEYSAACIYDKNPAPTDICGVTCIIGESGCPDAMECLALVPGAPFGACFFPDD